MPDDPEVVNLDGNVESADWTKRTWDFHGPWSYQADLIAGVTTLPLAEQQAKLDHFMILPAARAMPAKVKAELQRRGLHVAAP